MANPTLRFLDENGKPFADWEHTSFGNAFDGIGNNTLSRADLSDIGAVKNVHYGDILTTLGEIVSVQEENLPYIADAKKAEKHMVNVLHDGDIIIADTAEDETVGKAVELKDCTTPVVSGLHTMPFRPVSGLFEKGYLGYYLNSFAYHDQLRPLMQGIKVTSVSKSAIQGTEVNYPSSPTEQQKIATFFGEIDNLISATSDEIEALEQQKKSLMQKIFSQEVRFKRDDGSEYPKWMTLPLGKIVEQNNIPVSNPGSNYTKLAVRSHCKGTFHKHVGEDEGLAVDKMFLVEPNNLIVNITFAWEHAIAITKPEDEGTYVSHRFPQYRFMNGNLPSFYEYVIKNPRMKHEMGLCSPGGAGRNRVLNQKDFMKIPMVHPCPEEQQKIADCLSGMDELISSTKDRLEGYKQLKKGLMQRMFV